MALHKWPVFWEKSQPEPAYAAPSDDDLRLWQPAHADTANALYQSWVERIKKAVFNGVFKEFKANVRQIIADFEALPLNDERRPRIGLEGEIFVKFSPGANNDIVRLIEQEGGEVVMPGIMDFLLYYAYDHDFNHKVHSHSKIAALADNAAILAMDYYRKEIRKILKHSKRFSVPPTIDQIAHGAEKFLSRGNQLGEGAHWIVDFIESGEPNIVCMQPFACMPKHISGGLQTHQGPLSRRQHHSHRLRLAHLKSIRSTASS